MGRFKQLLGKGGDARAFQVVLVVKNLPANAGNTREGRSPGVGNGDPLQYSCLERFHGQRNLVGYGLWSHKE